MPTLKANHLSKTYKDGYWWRRKSKRHIELGVEDINLTVNQGEFLFVLGSCGAGKSTLLNLLSGAVRPSKGGATLDGANVRDLYRYNRRKLSTLIGVVPQNYAMDRQKTVRQNVQRALVGAITSQQRENRIQKVLGLVGLKEKIDKYPAELFEGERRRVALACALVNSPHVLILDEMIANQNDDHIWDIFLLLTELNRKGTTIIMSIHSSHYVNMLRKRVITLSDGRLIGDVAGGKYGEV